MNKPKAPKDMTVTEFVDLVERRYATGTGCNMDAWIDMLRKIAEEPAPNPFTPDQIAWMREEQRNGMKYAAKDSDGIISVYTSKPQKVLDAFDEYGEEPRPCWDLTGAQYYENGDMAEDVTHVKFLFDALKWEDEEPFCFADYAPLEGEKP